MCLLEVYFAVFGSGELLSQMMTWHWCDPRGAAAALGREPSKITKLLQSFKMLHNAQTQWHLARATQYCLRALVSSWNYAGLDCFLFMSLFLTLEQIVSVCCRLTTQGELKGCGSNLRAVLIGFRGMLCINQPEEKSKQALASVSLSRLQICLCGFIHTFTYCID